MFCGCLNILLGGYPQPRNCSGAIEAENTVRGSYSVNIRHWVVPIMTYTALPYPLFENRIPKAFIYESFGYPIFFGHIPYSEQNSTDDWINFMMRDISVLKPAGKHSYSTAEFMYSFTKPMINGVRRNKKKISYQKNLTVLCESFTKRYTIEIFFQAGKYIHKNYRRLRIR